MRAAFLSCVYLALAVWSPQANADGCSSAYTACQRRCDAIASTAQRVACKSECVAKKTGCKTSRWVEHTGDAIGDFFSGDDSGGGDSGAGGGRGDE